MTDSKKTKADLLAELEHLRRRNSKLERLVADVRHDRREPSSDRQQLHLAVEGAEMGLWDWNVETGEVVFSPRSAEMLGLSFEESTPLDGNWQDLIHPEDRTWVMDAVKAHLDGRTPFYEIEHRRRHRSGEWKWILSRGMVVERGPDGAPLRVTGIHLDITERKRAEKALQKSERRFRMLVETMNEGLTVLDNKGIVTYVNNKMAQMLGYSIAELIGHSSAEFFDEENRAILREQLARRLQGVDSATYEIAFTGRDGKKIPVIAAVTALRDENGQYVGSFGVVNDITERKRAERALKESEERYRLLVETVNDGFGVVDETGVFTYVNERFCEILGYTKHEVIGRSSADFHDGPGRKVHSEQLETWRRGEKSVYETVWVGKDGRRIPVLLSARPIFDQDGTFKGTLAVGTDISLLKETEERLRASLAEKELLLREIHHRVKNNLQTMSSLLRIQSRHLKDDMLQESFQEAESRIYSMALVHERLHEGRNLAEIEFDRYVERLVGFVLQSYGITGDRIVVRNKVESVVFSIDIAVPLGFILNELLSNCIKHAFPGGGTGEAVISLRALGSGEYELLVRDNGVGMVGMGICSGDDSPASLGLDLVRALAGQLKGNLQIRQDNGTEVRVSFKATDRAGASTDQRQDDVSPRQRLT